MDGNGNRKSEVPPKKVNPEILKERIEGFSEQCGIALHLLRGKPGVDVSESENVFGELRNEYAQWVDMLETAQKSDNEKGIEVAREGLRDLVASFSGFSIQLEAERQRLDGEDTESAGKSVVTTPTSDQEVVPVSVDAATTQSASAPADISVVGTTESESVGMVIGKRGTKAERKTGSEDEPIVEAGQVWRNRAGKEFKVEKTFLEDGEKMIKCVDADKRVSTPKKAEFVDAYTLVDDRIDRAFKVFEQAQKARVGAELSALSDRASFDAYFAANVREEEGKRREPFPDITMAVVSSKNPEGFTHSEEVRVERMLNGLRGELFKMLIARRREIGNGTVKKDTAKQEMDPDKPQEEKEEDKKAWFERCKAERGLRVTFNGDGTLFDVLDDKGTRLQKKRLYEKGTKEAVLAWVNNEKEKILAEMRANGEPIPAESAHSPKAAGFDDIQQPVIPKAMSGEKGPAMPIGGSPAAVGAEAYPDVADVEGLPADERAIVGGASDMDRALSEYDKMDANMVGGNDSTVVNTRGDGNQTIGGNVEGSTVFNVNGAGAQVHINHPGRDELNPVRTKVEPQPGELSFMDRDPAGGGAPVADNPGVPAATQEPGTPVTSVAGAVDNAGFGAGGLVGPAQTRVNGERISFGGLPPFTVDSGRFGMPGVPVEGAPGAPNQPPAPRAEQGPTVAELRANVARLTAEVEVERTNFARMDYEHTSMWRRVLGILNVRRDDQELGRAEAAYRNKVVELQNAQIALARRDDALTGESLRTRMAEVLMGAKFDEHEALYDTRLKQRTEANPECPYSIVMKRLEDAFKWYRGQKWYTKVAIGAGLGLGAAALSMSGAAATAGILFGIKRALGFAGTYSGAKGAMEGAALGKRRASAELETRRQLGDLENQKDSLIDSNGEPRWDMLRGFLNEDANNLNGRLQAMKNGARVRTGLAALAGAVVGFAPTVLTHIWRDEFGAAVPDTASHLASGGGSGAAVASHLPSGGGGHIAGAAAAYTAGGGVLSESALAGGVGAHESFLDGAGLPSDHIGHGLPDAIPADPSEALHSAGSPMGVTEADMLSEQNAFAEHLTAADMLKAEEAFAGQTLTVEPGSSIEGTIIDHLKTTTDMDPKTIGAMAHNMALKYAENHHMSFDDLNHIKPGTVIDLHSGNDQLIDSIDLKAAGVPGHSLAEAAAQHLDSAHDAVAHTASGVGGGPFDSSVVLNHSGAAAGVVDQYTQATGIDTLQTNMVEGHSFVHSYEKFIQEKAREYFSSNPEWEVPYERTTGNLWDGIFRTPDTDGVLNMAKNFDFGSEGMTKIAKLPVSGLLGSDSPIGFEQQQNLKEFIAAAKQAFPMRDAFGQVGDAHTGETMDGFVKRIALLMVDQKNNGVDIAVKGFGGVQMGRAGF